MRKMVIVRGPQASGKTTLVRSLGLEGHRLSADVIRTAHRGHVLNMKGELVVVEKDFLDVAALDFGFTGFG